MIDSHVGNLAAQIGKNSTRCSKDFPHMRFTHRIYWRYGHE